MNIIGDIGNTITKIHILDNNFKIKKKISIKTKKISKNYLNSKMIFVNYKQEKINKILFCSVVPHVFKKINSFFLKRYKKKCLELKNIEVDKYINIKVNKKEIGSDRLTNAFGVLNGKDNFIVIDLGTATTFDVVHKKSYIGGVIAPGLETSLKNLTEKASLIPKIHFKKTNKVIGKTTLSSVRSGFYWGHIGLIDKIINSIKEETKKKYKIIITGGLANLFKHKTKFKANIYKELTLYGLKKILKLLN